MPWASWFRCRIRLYIAGDGRRLPRNGMQRRDVVAQRQDAIELAIYLGDDILARHDLDMPEILRDLSQPRLQQFLGAVVGFYHG